MSESILGSLSQRIIDEINEKEWDKLKAAGARCFRVYDEANTNRQGWCRSFETHFDIDWDDGEQQRDIMDLSNIGVAKMPDAVSRAQRRPQKFA